MRFEKSDVKICVGLGEFKIIGISFMLFLKGFYAGVDLFSDFQKMREKGFIKKTQDRLKKQ